MTFPRTLIFLSVITVMPCFYKQLKIDPNTRFYFTNHTLHLCIKIQALRTVLAKWNKSSYCLFKSVFGFAPYKNRMLNFRMSAECQFLSKA